MRSGIRSKIVKALALIGFIVFVSAATTFLPGKGNVNERELLAYINNPENGLFQTKEIDEVRISIYYKPSDLLVLQQCKADTTIVIERAQKDFYPYCYFVLSISINGQELEGRFIRERNFEHHVNNLLNGMGKYIQIITDKGEHVALEKYTYPRMYGGSGSSSFILAFPKEKLKESDWFEVRINYPEINIINEKFRYVNSDLNSIPTLEF